MALTTNNQQLDSPHPQGSGALLPPEAEFMILAYLSIRDLDNAMSVSPYWRNCINDNKFFTSVRMVEDAAEIKELQRRLLHAIQCNQFNRVYRYIRMGAKAECNITGIINRQFSFMQLLGRPTSGHFVNPTLFSVAANVTYETEGAKIVSLLLLCGANPLATSRYHDYSSTASKHYPGHVIEYKGDESPINSAGDGSIKSIIGLAIFEKKLMETDNYPLILNQLTSACETDSLFVKEYLYALIQAQDKLTGVRFILPIEKINALRNTPEFAELYAETTSPGFFKQNWPWLAGASYLSFLLFCCKGAAMAALVANTVNLFTAVALSTAVCAVIGSVVASLIIMSCIFLINKVIKEYLIKQDNPHFPIVLNDSSRVSEYKGALFPKHNPLSFSESRPALMPSTRLANC